MQPLEANRWGGAYPDDRSAIADFTALLVRIATELVDDGMSRSYNQLREALLSNPEYVDVLPRVLREARTAGQFQAIVNREVNVDQDVTALVLSLFQDLAQRAYQLSSGDVRVTEDGDFRVTEDGDVRLTEDGEILLAEDGTPLLDEDGNPIEAEGTGGAAAEEGRTTREIASNWRDYFFTSDNGNPKEPRGDSANTDAASWTGVPSRAARLVAVRGQIEAAHEAIGYLIDEISADGGHRSRPLERRDGRGVCRRTREVWLRYGCFPPRQPRPLHRRGDDVRYPVSLRLGRLGRDGWRGSARHPKAVEGNKAGQS